MKTKDNKKNVPDWLEELETELKNRLSVDYGNADSDETNQESVSEIVESGISEILASGIDRIGLRLILFPKELSSGEIYNHPDIIPPSVFSKPTTT